MITSAIDGSAASTGTEISEADFLVLIQEFITETESLTSSKITSLALTIVQAKVTRREIVSELECEKSYFQVTLSDASIISELTTSVTTITAVGVTISDELVTMQTAFKELTGAEVEALIDRKLEID